MAVPDLTRALENAGIGYELLPHAHTETALAEAKALGLDPADVAKTLVVKTPEGYVRALLPATERIDLAKLRAVVGGSKKKVHLASEADLRRDYPEFDLAVPPLGGGRVDRVVVDRRVAERESIVFEAGSHDESIRLKTADLVRSSRADVADISKGE